MRFSSKTSHPIFLEPEGLTTYEVYPNGISTSLPFDVQLQLIHSIRGLENAHIMRPGYAIEYDFLDPRDLFPSLESRVLEKFYFCAGQINGTTGYEEAAAQGLIAGLNAAQKAKNKPMWWPRRDQAYIGVLIDDLITQGTLEPYRMFTSRAEYRLLLREDNADLRLSEQAYQLGLISATRWDAVCRKQAQIAQERQRLEKLWVRPGTALAESVVPYLNQALTREFRALDLLTRPELTYESLMNITEFGPGASDQRVGEQVEIQAKYQGYIERQQTEIERQSRYEQLALACDYDYNTVTGLSNEVREKLIRHRPLTLGQAARIPGVTPVLLVHLKSEPAITQQTSRIQFKWFRFRFVE